MQRYADANNLVNITVAAMEPVANASKRPNYVAGMIKGMQKHGFIKDSQRNLTYKGYPVTELHGHFPLPDNMGEYNNVTYVLFTDQRSYSAAINWHNSIEKPAYVDTILDRLSIQGGPPKQTTGQSNMSDTYVIAEKIGYYGVFVLLAAVAFKAIRRGRAKNSA